MRNSFETATFDDALFWIMKADSVDELEAIIEGVAFSERMTESEYCRVFDHAFKIVQTWNNK